MKETPAKVLEILSKWNMRILIVINSLTAGVS